MRTLMGVLVLLTGCVQITTPSLTPSPTVLLWARPGAKYDQFLKDRYSCLLESRTTSSTGAYYQGMGETTTVTVASLGLFQACMAARGYVERPDGFASPPSGAVTLVN